MRLKSLGLVLLLSGCVYQSAIKRGDAASTQQDWVAAYRAYEFAYTTNGKEEAKAKMEEARAAAVAAELSAATKASAAGEFEKAEKHFDMAMALDPENVEIDKSRGAARGELLAALEARMANLEEVDDLDETYIFVARAKHVFPESPEVEDAAMKLREEVAAKARKLLEEEEYAAARKTAALIVEYQPEHRTLASELDATIATAWADALVAEADKASRRQPGRAAALYARAYEIAEREDDKQNIAVHVERVVEDAPLGVYVDSAGSGRHWALRKAITPKVLELPLVEKAYSSNYELRAKVWAKRAGCDEDKETEEISKDYVAGQKDVPNPKHVELKEQLEEAQAAEKEAKAKRDELVPKLDEAEIELSGLQSKLERMKTAHDEAKTQLQQTKVQHEAALARIKEVQAEIEAAKTAGQDTAKLEEKLEMVKGFGTEWEATLATHTEEEKEAADKVAAVEAELEPAKAEVERLKPLVAEAEKSVETTSAEVTRLNAELAKVDPTMKEDINKTHTYTKTTGTVTCEAKTTLTFATKWDTELEDKQEIEGKQTMSDTWNPGHEASGVKEDKKEYPKEQKELTEALDTEVFDKTLKAVDAFVDDAYAVRVKAALAEPSEASTDTLISAFLGARERLDQEQVDAIIAYAKDTVGLEDIKSLDPEYAPKAEEVEEAEEAEEAEGEAGEAEKAESEETAEDAKDGAEGAEDADEAEKAEEPKKAEEDAKAEEPAKTDNEPAPSPWQGG